MIILKIGGGNTIALEHIINDLASLEEKIIIVHGANALRDELAQELDKPIIRVTSISGYSSVLSDREMIELLMMSYAGLRNKQIVELCQQRGINALGLCGMDGGVIRGKRNPGIRVLEEGKRKMLRDFSGKPKQVNRQLLDMLLENGNVPVLTVPIMDEDGFAINSENDDIVALLQSEYCAAQVIHLIEAPGFLKNSNDPSSLIPVLSKQELIDWETKAEGRFKRKLRAINTLFENGVKEVIIADGRTKTPLRDAINKSGTVIC
jgi:acetylglutamate/LysW-gamma-L-alpha-aminoadipate kinase